MDPLFTVPDLNEDELDAIQPLEFAYPQNNGGPIKGLPGIDLTDVLRTAVGNRQGPIPKAQLDELSPSQLRELKNQRFEESLGWARPLGQFYNVLTSPAVGEGMAIGVPNALSKLATWVIDPEGALELEAPQIPQEPLRAANPLREGDTADTSADQFGYELGAESAGEVVGAFTGSTLVRRVPQLANLANRLRQTQQVKRLAVAARTNRGVRRGVNTLRFGSEAMLDTSLAALFQDADLGNSGDLLDLLNIQHPLGTDPDNTYGENLRNTLIADGVLLPLSLIGAAQLTPWTRRLADGDTAWNLDELADVELAPYMPRQITQPMLPPGSPDQSFDSAIDRSTSSQLQIQQVQRQRDRVDAMFPGIRQLGTDQLAMDITAVGGTGTGNDLKTVRTPEGDEVVAGPDFDAEQLKFSNASPKQGELSLGEFGDTPDPRPEISTYLAELDELSDAQLQEVLRQVDTTEKLTQRQVQLQQTQAKVDELQATLAEVNERMALPEGDKRRLTAVGGKRKLNATQQQLDQQQILLSNLGAEPMDPARVGDQLALQLTQQPELPLTGPQDIELPPIKNFEWNEQAEAWLPTRAKEGTPGYASIEAYRSDIAGWNRDLLRRMAAPTNSPEVAAILKARTGRRVWNAKKEDIVNAMVEYASRSNRYAVPPEQLLIEGLQQNLNLTQDPEFVARGSQMLTEEVREEIKAKILRAALDNGEVQADVSPLPNELPTPEFNQGQLIDALFTPDADGQMTLLQGYANDSIPTYKAGGRNADALIEEVRQRFGWAELDGQAKRVSDQTLAEKNGWNKLTWEEKKRAGILSSGFYADTPGEVTEVTRVLDWTPEGNVAPGAAVAEPKASTSAPQTPAKPPRRRGRKRKTKNPLASQVQKARNNTANAQRDVDFLRKQFEEASCSG